MEMLPQLVKDVAAYRDGLKVFGNWVETFVADGANGARKVTVILHHIFFLELCVLFTILSLSLYRSNLCFSGIFPRKIEWENEG